MRKPILGILLAGVVAATGTPASAKDLKVVASFSVLGDVVGRVGGDRVEVMTLVGPNADPHEYEPAPNDARRLRAADLVFVSGLGMEGWMDRLIAAAGTKLAPVVASSAITPREMPAEAAAGAEHDHDHGGADGHGHAAAQDSAAAHDHGREDPHVWNDPRNVERWVQVIEAALAKADPEDAAVFQRNAAAYTAELKALDAHARAAIGRTPRQDRRILTSHDAFGYFGDAYGVTFLSPLGLSTESEASAAGIARLIDQIRAEKVSTYFLESSNDPRLVRQIAEATGARPGGELFVESLSDPRGPASTYAAMFRHNVDLIARALAPTN